MKFVMISFVRTVRLLFATGVVVLPCLPSQLSASDVRFDNNQMLVVEIGEQDTLRGLVGEYLNDPDLWPTVLELNNIGSVADVTPGMELRLPVKQVRAADDALLASLSAIQKANAEGARIFAPTEISQAIESREAAVAERERGAWQKVVSFAGGATEFAVKALEIAITQRDRAAEAIVSDVQGNVEGRAPDAPRWSSREVDDILVEFERMRTLSDSTTQITFRDLSKLRLNPNSNATIQRMRSDPLTGSEVTKVSLVNGDFYALLNQLSDRTSFEIDVPGVETNSKSGDFWVKNDQSGARFVNYDASEMQIIRNGESVLLGQNQGAVLGGKGAERTDVLSSPTPLSPAIGEIVYSQLSELQWQVSDEAAAYWVEVATDPGFNQMQLSEWGIREAVLRVELPPSQYFWRVAALDSLGLPGRWSPMHDFFVQEDTTPPFLTILSPQGGTISDQLVVEVIGIAEPDVVLLLNGQSLPIREDGSFLKAVSLSQGENTLTVQAVDPAGNQSTRSQTVIYRPAAQIGIELSSDIPRVEGALATRAQELPVRARTTASIGTLVRISDETGIAILQTQADRNGEIQFSVPADDTETHYRIDVLSPGGTSEGHLEFSVIRDQIAPKVALDLPLPRATSEDVVTLSGQALGATVLRLNGAAVPLNADRFELSMELDPGPNAFELAARDEVGNIAFLRLQTFLDQEPPIVQRVELARPNGLSGAIELRVQANDPSGLRQAAPFVVQVGDQEVEGFMRCDPFGGLCRASIPAAPGRLEVIELIVEDYAGNMAFN